jgi:hypothetical protein
VTGPAGTGGFAFKNTHPDGSAVTYDPCRSIHYVVNPAGGPPGGPRLVHRAVARVQAATGLAFVDDGATTERPNERRRLVQRDRYGDRWAPVLIAWADEDGYPALGGAVAGIGGSTPIDGGDDAHYVTGQIVLDRANSQLSTPAEAATARAIVLHELGHVVGLAHVPQPGELMYKDTVPGESTYGAGDLRGLALVGRGRCFPRD